jgi:hypothetical protein
VSKTFEQYAAEHTKAPFPLPMPGGESIDVPYGSINQQLAALRAYKAAVERGEVDRFAGLEHAVGADDAAKIAEAWGTMPPEAWDAVVEDMREFHGLGNSKASPPS